MTTMIMAMMGNRRLYSNGELLNVVCPPVSAPSAVSFLSLVTGHVPAGFAATITTLLMLGVRSDTSRAELLEGTTAKSCITTASVACCRWCRFAAFKRYGA